ncbi:unnamed protein product [Ectocarpus sp. 12 AP-2014]
MTPAQEATASGENKRAKTGVPGARSETFFLPTHETGLW